MKNLILRLSKSNDYAQYCDLHFDLIDSVFLPKWINRYLEAQQRQDNISEPWAFYNCNNSWTEEKILDFLNHHIDVCNSIVPGMFDKKITSVDDQDTLNYLHYIFEINHGQLDEWKKNSIFDQPRGKDLRESLSQINQTVHRCESFDNSPRIRVVYFDLPKTKQFTEEDYKLFVNSSDFGGLYTLYADVGKNLESLAIDNDDYHNDFVPNLHYSVDFQVKFYDDDGVKKNTKSQQFLSDNLDYFTKKGYTKDDPKLTTGNIKLGQLRYNDKQSVLNVLKNYDNIQSVYVF